MTSWSAYEYDIKKICQDAKEATEYSKKLPGSQVKETKVPGEPGTIWVVVIKSQRRSPEGKGEESK